MKHILFFEFKELIDKNIVLTEYMKKYNSEPDLVSLDHSPHFSSFFRKLRSPEYNERRTAEIVADNEIDTLMEEIDQTKPDDIVKQENKFIRKVYRTRPADNDRDFEELAKRVRRGGKKTRKRRKVTRNRRKLTKRRKLKKKKSTRKKRRGGVAPPAPSLPTIDEINPTMDEIRSTLQQISNRPYSYENSENFINLAFDILTDFDMMVHVVSASGYTSPYDDTPLDDFFYNVIIHNFEIAVENDARHVDTIRRRLRTAEIRNIINAIQTNEGALAPREGALRPSEKIQRYMDYIATLGDDPMDVEGGKRRKKKKSTRKKRRGGVQPDAPPVTRRNQMTRSRMPHAPLLIQGLNQVRNMPFVYIETAMIRLSDPQVVRNLDQEGRLDEIMNLVTERITFFVSRNQVSREQLREYLDETTEAHQTLQGVDMNLAARYGNFIEGLGQLTN